jgi:hypothetical protein
LYCRCCRPDSARCRLLLLLLLTPASLLLLLDV